MIANRPATSHLIVLTFILMFAALLRGYGITMVGLWTDEFCSLSDAHGWGLRITKVPTDRIITDWPRCTRISDAAPSASVVSAIARDDTHPPLYFLMLRMWENLFGDSESGVRSLNIGFSLIAIALFYFAVRDSVDSPTALWAAMLMAVASPQIIFSLEARDYMPAMTFQLAAGWASIRLRRLRSIYAAIVLGLMLFAAMMTHYYSVGVAVALVIFLLLSTDGRTRMLAMLAAIGSTGAFLVVWGPRLVEQLPVFQNGMNWLLDTYPGRLERWMIRLCRVPGELIASGLPPVSAGLGLIFLFLPWLYWSRPKLRIWVLWLVASLALVAGVDMARSTIQLGVPRFLLFSSPAAYVMLAAVGRGRWRWVPPAGGVFIALLYLQSAYIPSWKIDFRTPVQRVGLQLAANDGLVISGPDPMFASITYSAFQYYLPSMPVSVVLTRPADTATFARLRQCPRVWVCWLWPNKPVEALLPGYRYAPKNRGHLPFFGDLILGRIGNDPARRSGRE